MKLRRSHNCSNFVMEVHIGTVNWELYQYKHRPYMYGGLLDKVGTVVRPFGLHNGHSHAGKTKSV